MSISSGLSIAASSLLSQKQALDVIANNIANANTPGYSKQQAVLSTQTPQTINGLSFGRGVQLTQIARVIDPLLQHAQMSSGAQQGYWQRLDSSMQTLQSTFGSLSATNLNKQLDTFFQDWQSLANQPQGQAERVQLRASADQLAQRFRSMSGQLQQAQQLADTSINDAITQANQWIDQLASLNSSIGRMPASSPANDLLDQRDVLLSKLNRLIPVQIVQKPNQQLTVQTLQGDSLIDGATVVHLQRGGAVVNGFSGLQLSTSVNVPLPASAGGELAALSSFRDQQVASYQQQLDSTASNLIFAVNRAHASGVGLSMSTSMTSTQLLNKTNLAVDAAAQTSPFAAQVQTGSFMVHRYDATGAALLPVSTVIQVTAGLTTPNQVMAQLNAAGLNASLDATGHLSIKPGLGAASFSLSADSSQFLAAYGLNAFYAGSKASDLAVDAAVLANASSIAAGSVDAATGLKLAGANDVALAMVQVQAQALSFDGTKAASLAQRSSSLSVAYGSEQNIATQQLSFAKTQSASLQARRDAVSGVNVDAEMVKMLQFQQAYQASAKVFQVANRMMDSLMQLVR